MRFKPAMQLSLAAGYFIDVLRPAALMVAGMAARTARSLAQTAGADAIPYCAQWKELNNHAMSRERFAPIIGPPRDGNYRQAKLLLTGWNNCAFYGTNTYTCDSSELTSRAEAAKDPPPIAPDTLHCM